MARHLRGSLRSRRAGGWCAGSGDGKGLYLPGEDRGGPIPRNGCGGADTGIRGDNRVHRAGGPALRPDPRPDRGDGGGARDGGGHGLLLRRLQVHAGRRGRAGGASPVACHLRRPGRPGRTEPLRAGTGHRPLGGVRGDVAGRPGLRRRRGGARPRPGTGPPAGDRLPRRRRHRNAGGGGGGGHPRRALLRRPTGLDRRRHW